MLIKVCSIISFEIDYFLIQTSLKPAELKSGKTVYQKKHVSKKIFEKNGDHFKIMWGAFVCHEFVFFF